MLLLVLFEVTSKDILESKEQRKNAVGNRQMVFPM